MENKKLLLNTIPENTINFIISGNENQSNFQVIAQKVKGSKHILNKNLTQNEAINLVSKYLAKHQGK